MDIKGYHENLVRRIRVIESSLDTSFYNKADAVSYWCEVIDKLNMVDVEYIVNFNDASDRSYMLPVPTGKYLLTIPALREACVNALIEQKLGLNNDA